MQKKEIYGSDFVDLSNEELVVLSQEGREESAAILLERVDDVIHQIINIYNDPSVEKEDMEQEAKIACLNAIRSYNPKKGSSFRTFAAVCINNRILNFIKSKNSKQMVSQKEFMNIDEADYDTVSESDDFSPENIIIDREKYEDLGNVFKKVLSPLEYKVLCCIASDLSYEETAEKLQLSQKSVDNAVQRMRKKLRNILS